MGFRGTNVFEALGVCGFELTHAGVKPARLKSHRCNAMFSNFAPIFFSLLAYCTSYLYYFSLLFCYSIDIAMVENVANDGVESKPVIIEASGNVKPTVNMKLKVKILFQAHIEEKSKSVPTGVAKLHGYEVDTASFF